MFLTSAVIRHLSYIMIQHAGTHTLLDTTETKVSWNNTYLYYKCSAIFILKNSSYNQPNWKHWVIGRIRMRKCGWMWRTQRCSWTPRLQWALFSQSSPVSHVVGAGDIPSSEDSATASRCETSSSHTLPTHHHLPLQPQLSIFLNL